MAAVAAPALAFGPPGWVVFGLAVVGTAAVAALSVAGPRSTSTSRTATRTGDIAVQKCPERPWSVRVHAQGTDIGGTSRSTVGAPPIVQMAPISVMQGVALASSTFGLLVSTQQRNLEPAYRKSVAFMRGCPPSGFLGKKSFYGLSRDNNRFDVDSFGCSPNFIT